MFQCLLENDTKSFRILAKNYKYYILKNKIKKF